MTWTIEEDEYLRDNYETKTTLQLSKEIGKNYTSTSERCTKLGLFNPKTDKICSTCGKLFKPKEKKHRFCSRKCSTQWANVKRRKDFPFKCAFCGKEIIINMYDNLRHTKRKFCSPECKQLSKETHQKRKISTFVEWIQDKHPEIYTEFWHDRNGKHMFKTQPLFLKECEFCHKKFKPLKGRNYIQRFCSVRCVHNSQKKVSSRNRVNVEVNDELFTFLSLKDNKCDYVRGLIEADMKK